MKVQHYHYAGLALLSSTLALVSRNVIASSTGSGTSTMGCVPDYVSDGDCDEQNNTDECGYDGGDCCECTCVDTAQWICGDGLFSCLDPSAACFGNDDVTTLPTTEDYSGSPTATAQGCATGFTSDGDCDLQNNTEACGYDGGDCCECTCVDSARWVCGEHGFSCLDPDAPCVDDDDVTTVPTTSADYSESTTATTPVCLLDFISDGDCDLDNNTEECGYDGGDCCECTCISNRVYTCGDLSRGGFKCIDPSAPCSDDDDEGNRSASFSFDDVLASFSFDDMSASYSFDTWGGDFFSCLEDFIGDGDCDTINNREECDYDGGDCCECDCVDTFESLCGLPNAFDCIDPTSLCVDGQVQAGIFATEGQATGEDGGRGGRETRC